MRCFSSGRLPTLLATLVFATACVSIRPYADAIRELPAGRLIEIDGQQVSVEQSGSGEPLVLLHGFGESTISFAPVLPELARHFAVVAIDLNGFGYTQRLRDPARYTLAGQERLVLGVLDRLKLQRVRIAGHSYGGGLALYLAARHPERIDRLLLIDNTLPLYASARRNPFFRWRWVANLAARTFALSNWRIEAGLEKAYFDDALVTKALVRDYADRLRIEGAADALYGLVGPSVEPPFRLDLESLRIPTLVVWGAEDKLIDVAGAEERAKLLPDATFVVLPGCGHSPMEECPVAFLAVALPFLERASPLATSVPASSDR